MNSGKQRHFRRQRGGGLRGSAPGDDARGGGDLQPGRLGAMGTWATWRGSTATPGWRTAGDIFLGSGQQDLGWLGLIRGSRGRAGKEFRSGVWGSQTTWRVGRRTGETSGTGAGAPAGPALRLHHRDFRLGRDVGMRHGQTDNPARSPRSRKQRPGWEDIAIGAGVSALGNWLGG